MVFGQRYIQLSARTEAHQLNPSSTTSHGRFPGTRRSMRFAMNLKGKVHGLEKIWLVRFHAKFASSLPVPDQWLSSATMKCAKAQFIPS
jgi:hypothetical protein